MNVEERIKVFEELLCSVHNIYLTSLNTDYEVINKGKEKEEDLSLLFPWRELFVGEYKTAGEHGLFQGEQEVGAPLVFTNGIGMTWMSDFDIREGKLHRIYLLGPVFLDDYSLEKINTKLNEMHSSVMMKHRFLETMKRIPVIDLRRFYEYGIMLHCAITGKRISLKDFIYPEMESGVDNDEVLQERHGIHMAESRILKLVEEGNLNYEQEMEKYVTMGNIGKVGNGDFIREGKNLVIMFTTLCASAAIRGGLSSEAAYYLREFYIQEVEKAESLGKINEISHTMIKDFVCRVHQQILDSETMSAQIKAACDYICLHLNEKTNIHFLAARAGYADYYFSNKFRKETGQNVRDYANQKRIGKAKELLATTNMEIRDICGELGYGSQSYFGKVFRRETGTSPLAYRENQKKERKR